MNLPAIRDPSEEDVKKNPYVYRINGYWTELQEKLASFDGAGAAQILSQLGESPDSLDKAIWNALYWRTDSWFKKYLGRRPMSEGEEKVGFERHEVGGPRWVAWLQEVYADRPNPINWQTEDLKFILQRLGDME